MENRIVVIYHASCADGFCAAWLFWRHFNYIAYRDGSRDVEFLPAHYGDDPPNVDGKEVYIVDFSYPRETLERMHQVAKSLIVLDHHKTAESALHGLDYCTFDMGKSGGRLSFEYLQPDNVYSNWLVDYTEDRDLWLWKLPDSKEINAALRSYPLDFLVWNGLYDNGREALIQEGKAILRYQQQTVDDAVLKARNVWICGYEVPCLNTTTLISEIAGTLAEGNPFAATWFENQAGHRVYSLRSREGGIDVSEVAKRFGGGGHAKAAGFMIEMDGGEVDLNI